MTPLSNYPRPPVQPEFRIWPGDAILGGAFMVDLLIGLPEMWRSFGDERIHVAKGVVIGVMAGLLLVVTALNIQIVRGKRWAMWLILALTVISLFGELTRPIPTNPSDLFSRALELVTLVYLPLRLFRRIGPALR